MARPQTACLDDNVVALLIERALPDADMPRIEAHLDACAACREVMVGVVRAFGPASTARTCARPSVPPRGGAVPSTHANDLDGGELPATGAMLPRGATVGRYIALDVLGVGGTGIVYAAYDPELDRKVALKLLRSADQQERLLREAQAMARVAHPNVLPVFDVGPLRDGVFVAMELVEGKTLRGFMTDGPHPLHDILRVFLQAGRGLAAAHAAGLIHRDFKPENVLCGQDGRIRVSDFGLARSLADPAQEPQLAIARDPAHTLTQTSAVAGTPAYMAPELVDGQPAGERSDEFSFCVTLYEALYGERPFAGDSVDELVAAAARGELRRPATERRVPTWLRRVVARGLRPRPEDRYPSMAALLSELGRDKRRLRRNLGAIATGVVLLGLGVAFGRSHDSPPPPCQASGRELAAVWSDAVKLTVHRAFTASGVSYADTAFRGVEIALDRYARDWTAMRQQACEATRVDGNQSDEVLTLRMSCLEHRKAELAGMVHAFEAVEPSLVEHAVDASNKLSPISDCARVEALREVVKPPKELRIADAIAKLDSRLVDVQTLASLGQFTKALPSAQQLLDDAKQLGYRPLEAEAALAFGYIQYQRQDNQAANDLLVEAVWAAEAGRHGKVLAQACSLLVGIATRGQGVESALRWRDCARSALEQLGDDGTMRTELESFEADVLDLQGKVEESIAKREHALAIVERIEGSDSPQAANQRFNLGLELERDGRDRDAIPILEAGLSIAERAYGRTHPDYGRILDARAYARAALKDYVPARADAEQALAIFERALGPDHPNVAEAVQALANIDSELGEHARAEAEYERALALQKKVYGPNDRMVGINLANLGAHYVDRHAYAKAMPYFEQALPILEKALAGDHPQVGQCLSGLGQAQWKLGRTDDAIGTLTRALAIFEAHPGDDASLGDVRFTLAQVLWNGNRDREKAIALARAAQQAYGNLGDSASKELGEVTAWLAQHAPR